MLEIISPTLKRQLQILQYLYKNGESPMKVKELTSFIQATESTIRSDIKRINENFPTFRVEIYPQSKVKLFYPDYVGIEHIFKNVMNLSMEVTIFECLLERPNQPKEFYIDKFFISLSSFRRIIKRWNDFFQRKKLDMFISVTPVVSVNGDELTIRKLFYQCMVEKYMGDLQTNFLEKKHSNSIWEIIKYLENIFSIKSSYTTHLKLSYWFYVCIQRIKHKCFIQEAPKETNRKISKLLYDKINQNTILKAQFVHDHQITLSIENLLDIICIYDLDLFLTEHLTKDISYYQFNDDLSMDKLKDFLLAFYKSIKYDTPFFESTLALVYFFLTWHNPTPIPYLFYNRFKAFREYVKKENTFALEMFDVHLEKSNLPSYVKQSDDLKDELLYHVVIHTQTLLDSLHQIPKTKILVLVTFSKNFMYSIKKRVEETFDERVSVSIYHSTHLPLDMKYLKQFDIILTNHFYLSDELDDKIIYLDIEKSAEFIEKIKKKLNKH